MDGCTCAEGAVSPMKQFSLIKVVAPIRTLALITVLSPTVAPVPICAEESITADGDTSDPQLWFASSWPIKSNAVLKKQYKTDDIIFFVKSLTFLFGNTS